MAVDNIAIEELTMYINRIERLENDKSDIAAQISEVYSDAKNKGYDVKVMKQIVKLRKMDEEEREEQEMLLDTYKRALGMVGSIDHIE